LINREIKEKAKTQTETGQKMVNQKDLLWKTKEIILLEMIGKNKDALDAAKKATSKETA